MFARNKPRVKEFTQVGAVGLKSFVDALDQLIATMHEMIVLYCAEQEVCLIHVGLPFFQSYV
jgi:hypothetical protein